MDNSTSSAEPQALFHYADTATRINNQLLLEANHLSAALQHFAAACTEYRLEVDSRLSHSLRNYVSDTANTDQWVRQVGEEFQRADMSGMGMFEGVGGVAAIDSALQWLGNGLLAEESFWERFKFYDQKFLEFIKHFAKNRGYIRDRFLELGRTVNKVTGKQGYVGKMDDLYRVSLSQGIPYRGGMDRFLKSNVFQKGLKVVDYGSSALDVFLAGYENWEEYKDDTSELRNEKIVVGTVVDSAVSIGTPILVGQIVGGVIGSFGGPLGTATGVAIGGFIGQAIGTEIAIKFKDSEARDKVVDWSAEKVEQGEHLASQGFNSAKQATQKAANELKDEAQKVERAIGSVANKLISCF